MNLDKNFWASKTVLVTGNTGFKGIWLTKLLLELNAKVIGFSKDDIHLSIKKEKLKKNKNFIQIYQDINNLSFLKKVVIKYKPELIFHLAAQSLVFKSYINPDETFKVNTLGTLNILELAKNYSFIKSTIIITSDKCYKPLNNKKFFDENSALGGNDPYSASKANAEIMSMSYIKSFPKLNVATARAGNVIGGGDWSQKRLLPDLMKLIYEEKKLKIRNLMSVRPWQFVLEPLIGYLLLSKKLYENRNKNNSIYRSAWNFGPSNKNHKNVKSLIEILEKNLKSKIFYSKEKNKFQEEKTIFLNSYKSKSLLQWNSFLSLKDSVKLTHQWYENNYKKKDKIENFTGLQIKEYIKLLDEYKTNKN